MLERLEHVESRSAWSRSRGQHSGDDRDGDLKSPQRAVGMANATRSESATPLSLARKMPTRSPGAAPIRAVTMLSCDHAADLAARQADRPWSMPISRVRSKTDRTTC